MTEALPNHDLISGRGAINHAHQVDVNDAPPVFQLQILHFTADADSSVVEDEIEPPMFCNRFIYQSLHLFGIADIKGNGFGSAAALFDLIGDTARALTVEVGNDGKGAAFRECLGKSFADA